MKAKRGLLLGTNTVTKGFFSLIESMMVNAYTYVTKNDDVRLTVRRRVKPRNDDSCVEHQTTDNDQVVEYRT